ncbi:S-adenosyl-L-methionine-dependent methyltransferase [Hypoxylon sp. NC0597]|nr:S-adenosyl-L-methionine-dependent methyltransferase [Hypoxylon sp. NC0597]
MAHEETFLSYTEAQGKAYAADRPRYSPELFKTIIDHHTSTGGQLDTVVDVGCGTGQATRDLASYFYTLVGLDPSEGMINTARSSSEFVTSPIRFKVSAAEVLGADIEPPITDGSVDLLTAATAAHWFDMERFWSSAARVLKPGGTVALWARTGMSIDPIMTPNGAAVKAAVDEAVGELEPYMNLGNKLSRDLYIDLLKRL